MKQVNNANRRKKGTGTVYQLESGLWRGRIVKNGKPFQFYGKTEKEAEKKLDEFVVKYSLGVTKQRRLSFEDFLLEWLAVKKLKLKPQS